MKYEDMLKKARMSLPESVHLAERFEVPLVKGHIEGNRTIIINFVQIAGVLNRDVNHFLKFVLKELATPGEIKQGRLIIGTKVSASKINEKIRQYVKTFVICPECGKPDTIIKKIDSVTEMKCQVCGAKSVVRSKI